MSNETLVIMIVMIVYIAGLLLIGFRMSKQIKTLDDYILAGRNLPWYVLSLTFAAAVANTATVMGQPGFAYSIGFTYVFWSSLSSETISVLLLSRIGVRLRSMNLTTISDLANARFGNSRRLEIVLSLWQVVWGIFIVGMSLFGVSLVLEVILGIPWQYTIAPIAIITILYTMSGGLRAVVITDAAQMLIIVLGVGLLFFMITAKYGLFTDFLSKYVGDTGFNLTDASKGLTLFPGFTDLFTLPPGQTIMGLIAFIMATSFWIPIDLGFIQRSLAAKTLKDGRKSVYFYALVDWFNAWILVLLGGFGAILLPGLINTDEVVIRLAREILPLIGAALVVTAVVSAAMSTISVYLNAGSGIIVKNIILRIKPNIGTKMELRLTRLITVAIGLLALGFTPFISNNGIVMAAVAMQIIMISALTPLVLLALYWRKTTEAAAFWGCIITSAVTLFMMINVGGPYAASGGAGYFGIPVIFWSIALALVLYVGVSLIRPEKRDVMSPECKAMFEQKNKLSSHKDLLVFAIIWGVLAAIGIYKKMSGSKTAFPPLSGSGAWITNGVFYAMSLFTAGLCIFLTYRVYRHMRNN
ncbi:sodium:solute symporter family protein [Paenibacillus chibensis]|uniref:sodium:solute symporter family protein n=1 Tax=Paenibacillus chibensis TaxID=59846 RepID=UPI000FDBF64E|nr:sodium:solute symporter family protein [Paenibacillus chibensis]MEC0368843.1 sodium:solute symporter family protein [Paenibacillus chibensis]